MFDHIVFLYWYALNEVMKRNFLLTKMTIQPLVVKDMMEKGMFLDTSDYKKLEEDLKNQNETILYSYGDFVFYDIRVKDDFSVSFSCNFFSLYSLHAVTQLISDFIPRIKSVEEMEKWKKSFYKKYLKFRMCAKFGRFFDVIEDHYDDIYESVLHASDFNYLNVIEEGEHHMLLLKDLFDGEEVK